MKSTKRLKKALLLTVVFTLNVAFGHFTVEFLRSDENKVFSGPGVKTNDGWGIYKLKNDVPQEYQSVVEKGHSTVLK